MEFSSAAHGGGFSQGRPPQTRGPDVMALLVKEAFLVLKEHRADLQRRLEDLESGVLRVAETRLWAAPVDIRRKIAEIDDILMRV